ncbi:DUF354 domain-containing protein, partial [Methanoculleus sp. MH98A]|uniref:DUF354 domain-containing protein n=1 Tax=Methanoculleus sp. MH98A TaxID=1495314 RepID=UPI00049FFC69
MRILFDLGHPAHVHFFKYVIRNLEREGHQVKICVRERESIVKTLLASYGYAYENLERNTPGLLNKAVTMIKNDIRLFKISQKFDPDLYVSMTSPYSSQVSKLRGKPSIVFTDSEPTGLILSLTLPFTDAVITPINFKKDLGKKHVRISGFKESAYLHPNWFRPDPGVLDLLGVSKEEKYTLLRFNAFDASHDIGIKGFSGDDKKHLVRELEKYSRVFISSETQLPADLEDYAIRIPPHKMHDVLYYASLLVGDTQTSTTEAAYLGTPAVRCNSFVGPDDMSNFVELERTYGLIFNFADPDEAIGKSIELIQRPDIKQEWAVKREKLLQEKI